MLNGPARTAHGYARVDELDVTAFLHHGVNHLAVEMLVYGDVYNKYSNDCTLEPDGFLLCELEADGQVLTATGGADWNACRIAARVANASRISHSREASEIYTLEPGWDGWIMGEADGTNGFCRTAPGVRTAPAPAYRRNDNADRASLFPRVRLRHVRDRPRSATATPVL